MGPDILSSSVDQLNGTRYSILKCQPNKWDQIFYPQVSTTEMGPDIFILKFQPKKWDQIFYPQVLIK